MSTIYDYVGRVRNQIRDNGITQVFEDVTDTTLATPAIIPNNSPELTQYVQDAVSEFSRYRPLRKPYTLNLIAGQTTYTLPSDWISVDRSMFHKALHPRTIPDLMQYQLPWVEVSPELPLDNALEFNWYDEEQQLILRTAPLVGYTLNIAYFAYHEVDKTSSTIPRHWENAMLYTANESALRAIATDFGVKLQRYRLGGRFGIDVDNHTIAENLLKQADDFRERFRTEVVLRPSGGMGPDDELGSVDDGDW